MTALTFHGGVREVTGANYLLESGRARVLVDCGLHQGCHFCEGRNRRPFPYDPASIDAVVVTHAHVDHTGLLPKLVRDGFRGQIFATAPTKNFAEILLQDAARLIAEEAKERGEDPPYLARHVAPTIERFTATPYHEPRDIAPGVRLTLFDAGHVLGSAIVLLEAGGIRIAFSGDLGNPPTPLLRDTETIETADYALIESAYGDRHHEDREQRREMLREAILRIVKQRGTLLIPVFAFERTQELLAEMNALVEHGHVPAIPVFLDSPLAVKATAIYQRYPQYYNTEARKAIVAGDLPFRFPGLQFTESVEASKKINEVRPPKIILAGSGMLQGGRVLHHARRALPDPNSMLLIVGYQPAGSLGRRLLAHARRVRILGEETEVRASVKAIGGYSGHADQDGLFAWLSAMRGKPRRVFIVQGEEPASFAFRQVVRDRLGLDASVPLPDERVALS